jgi:hypothetical protein
LIFCPFTQAERAVKAKGKREAAQQGPARSRQAQGGAFREPSEPNGEGGKPRSVRPQSQGGFLLVRFLWAAKENEPVVRGRNPDLIS